MLLSFYHFNQEELFMLEQVLCVSTEHFHECGHFDGFHACATAEALDKYSFLFDPLFQFFFDRKAAEADHEWKQLIPYVMVCRGGRVAAYYRGVGQGEDRLHCKRSIGIGGPINPAEDAVEESLPAVTNVPSFVGERYLKAVSRELCEELEFENLPESGFPLPIVGLINDDSTDVGKVHLGVVHQLMLPMPVNCHENEDDMLDFAFFTKPQLVEDHRGYMRDAAAAKTAGNEYTGPLFESWSQICLEHALGYPSTRQKKGV